MRIVTASEMKEMDRRAMEQYGIPGVVLMENAGLRVVEVIQDVLKEVKGKVFTILVGKGNNGGDGLVVARHLHNRGSQVKVLLLADPEEFQGDARVNLNIWQKMGQPLYQVNQINGINIVKVALLNTDLIVDALYGTGFHGSVNEKVGRVIDLINASRLPVVAVDIPSGVEADTGRAYGPCIQADHTVTFGLPKIGLVVEPGAGYAGRLHVVGA
ncbi:MAG: NAD(P)H-hydrate epimerase, partial [Firmicutes bacterium]|nr:NAD(P)H-hydrate epimerase [Bacillota bacterium]